jgi:hypothetical protein
MRFAALRGDRQPRRAAEIEVSPVPEVGLDDPPAADQPRQIVSGGCEGEGPSDALATAELGSLLAGDGLDPAEGLLDPFADALAHVIARVSRRAAVNRRGTPPIGILRDVRRRIHRAQFIDEVRCVVGFVGAESNGPRSIGMRLA